MVKIIECKKEKKGYLIKTEPSDIFYIDGKGGQLGDRGSVGEANVLEVKEEGILVDKELELKEYNFNIDKKRRVDIAQQHTAQHLFSAIAYNDYNLNTVGFRMADEYTTVDLDSNTINEEIIEKIEQKANDIIMQNIEIRTYIKSHEEAMQVEGLRKAIKDKVTGDVRFVEIVGVDLGACAGFHVASTKDLRLFKIVYHEKVKGNFTRFYFIAGDRALADYRYKHMVSRDICHMFSCKENEMLDKIEKSIDEKKQIESELKNISIQYAEILAKKLKDNSKKVNGYDLIVYVGEKEVVQFLPRFIEGNNLVLVTGTENSYSIVSQILNCKEFIQYLVSKSQNIKGGGNQIKGNFKGSITKEELETYLVEYINSLL